MRTRCVRAVLLPSLLALAIVGPPCWAAAASALPAPASATDARAPEPAAQVPPARTSPEQPHASRSLIERAWFGAGPDLEERGALARLKALELGADNVEGAARALIASARGGDALAACLLAVRLAPDLPLAHMALAHAYWDAGKYQEMLIQALAGIAAIARHLEASIWLVGSLLVMFASVLIAGSLVFIGLVGISAFSAAAHDLGDLVSKEMPAFARAAMLFAFLLLPVVLGEGVMGLALVLFAVGFAYGSSRHRTTLALSAVLVVLGLYPVLRLAGTALTALDADPVAAASLSVIRGSEMPSQVELLSRASERGDDLASYVLAVRSRRHGEIEDAEQRYLRLLERRAADPVILATLANLSFQRGQTEKAIDLYERASTIETSATLMFDLSQAYARAFRMEEFEHTMERAQGLDASRVVELSGQGDIHFVADLPFPIELIRDRMVAGADGGAFSRALSQLLAPGWSGRGWMNTAGSFLLAAFVAFAIGGLYQHASRCARCGGRICARCDDSMWSSDLCDGCHHLFHRPQGTDPALRMARLQELRVREAQVQKVDVALSLIVPGASGLLARRPGLSFFGVILFAWAIVLFMWRNGVVPDPLSVGGAGPLAFVLAGCAMWLLYIGVLISGLMIRRSL